MRRQGKETEIKLALRGTTGLRWRLRRLGFRVRERRGFEQNTLFDTAEGALRRRGCMLRLRSLNGRHWLTFKGPADRSRRYKVRPEFEAELSDAPAARQILVGLGFRPVFRYEKFRTVYAGRGGWQGGEVMLDETPIGTFVELEGRRRWIQRLARVLGAGPSSFITSTYAALYVDWCRHRARPVKNMLFPRNWRLTKGKRRRI